MKINIIESFSYLSETLRFKQWIKNLFILSPVVFSGRLIYPGSFYDCVLAFLGFCLVSSSIYTINDLHDLTTDQFHPRKSLTSFKKKSSFRVAVMLVSISLLGTGFWICSLVSKEVFLIVFIYFLINIIYTFFVKEIVFLDVVFITIGFQLRIWAGAMAANVHPSLWIQICILFLSLFLGFSKRQREIIVLGDKAFFYRPVLSRYSPFILSQFIVALAFLTVFSYGLYSFFSFNASVVGKSYLGFSSIFVALGIVRYRTLIYLQNQKIDPGEIIFSDKVLLLIVFLWTFYILALFYFKNFNICQ